MAHDERRLIILEAQKKAISMVSVDVQYTVDGKWFPSHPII
jgi:hypothetical protein